MHLTDILSIPLRFFDNNYRALMSSNVISRLYSKNAFLAKMILLVTHIQWLITENFLSVLHRYLLDPFNEFSHFDWDPSKCPSIFPFWHNILFLVIPLAVIDQWLITTSHLSTLIEFYYITVYKGVTSVTSGVHFAKNAFFDQSDTSGSPT